MKGDSPQHSVQHTEAQVRVLRGTEESEGPKGAYSHGKCLASAPRAVCLLTSILDGAGVKWHGHSVDNAAMTGIWNLEAEPGLCWLALTSVGNRLFPGPWAL
jgi:hypothetical protein